MNISLVQWAFNQDTKRSSEKLTLVAMACLSNKYNLSRQTVARLCRDTGLAAATVSAAIKSLEIGGYIIDTEKKSGKTRIFRFPDEATL